MTIHKIFVFNKQHVVIEVSERKADCPEPETFKKISHHKKKKENIVIPMMRGREKRLTWP